MIQDIYDKLLRLFVDKGIDYCLKYNDRGDRYIINETIEDRYILFYSCIDGYYDSYVNLYMNNNEPVGEMRTMLALYPLNLFLLLRLFYETKN